MHQHLDLRMQTLKVIKLTFQLGCYVERREYDFRQFNAFKTNLDKHNQRMELISSLLQHQLFASIGLWLDQYLKDKNNSKS